jgi:hypothetical protein
MKVDEAEIKADEANIDEVKVQPENRQGRRQQEDNRQK